MIASNNFEVNICDSVYEMPREARQMNIVTTIAIAKYITKETKQIIRPIILMVTYLG